MRQLWCLPLHVGRWVTDMSLEEHGYAENERESEFGWLVDQELQVGNWLSSCACVARLCSPFLPSLW